jgi:iron complex outermembrane receptor protein
MNSRTHILAATSLLAFSGVSSAQAQTAADDDGRVAEILVTAQKRSSSLQTTSVAVTALSGDGLKDKAVTNLEGLTTASPSLSFAGQGPTAAVNLRGIGLGVSSPNVAPGVPIYRDGLLAPTLLPNEPFLDIASVEVLRGPQGTLVGANSTGGAVFINTASPVLGRSEGYGEVEGGSYQRLRAAGAVNVPVSDVLALRAAASAERRDSYFANRQPSQTTPEPGALRQFAGRLSALYQPNERFSALLKINYQNDDNGGWAHTPYPGTPAAVGYPTQPYVLSYGNMGTYSRDNQLRVGLEMKYAFASGVILKSTSGMFLTRQHYNDNQYVYTSPTTASASAFVNNINDQVYSQELNLVSPRSKRLHWVIGNFNYVQRAHISLNPNNPVILVDQGTPKFSTAAYGELGFDITPKVEVHIGLRETYNKISGNGGVYLALPGATPLLLAPNTPRFSDSQLTGRIGLDWTISSEHFAYIVAAKGGKTGGVNGTGQANFASEAVYDYEIGLKSKWLDGHLRTQLGAFYMNYKNLQLSTAAPSTVAGQAPNGSITNAGSSTVKGFEASAQLRFGGLQVDGNLSYVDATVQAGTLLNTYAYTAAGFSPTGPQCATGQTSGCFNFAPYYVNVNNSPSPFSPKWTGNLGASYAFALTPDLSLTPRLDFSHMDSQWTSVFGNGAERMQARNLLNASVTLARGGWTLTAYGTNLTKQYFITGQTAFQNFWNAPREFGARVNYRF